MKKYVYTAAVMSALFTLCSCSPAQNRQQPSSPERTLEESSSAFISSTSADNETAIEKASSPSSVNVVVLSSGTAADIQVPDNIVDVSHQLYTYDEMCEDLSELSAYYPELISVTTAGYTADNRSIYQCTFGNPSADKQIFICASTHGREYMTSQLVMKQLEYYCRSYYSDSFSGIPYSELFDRTCFIIVPMVNPDGVSISQLGLDGIRDTGLRTGIEQIYSADFACGFTTDALPAYLTRWKANARGVDLNRNFSPGWELVNERTSPSSDHYKGTSPGSENETCILMNILNTLNNPLSAISYHSYGSLVYWQYGQSEPLWSKNEALAAHIQNITGYGPAGYSNEAGFSNWCVHVRGIPSVTVETGTVPTPLPAEQFESIWAANRYLWAALACVLE